MSNNITVYSTDFVCASDVIPKRWSKWFWDLFSDNAPFSWGDNNHTLVAIESFADHCKACLIDSPKGVSKKAKVAFINKLLAIKQPYVDLEN